MNWSQSSARNPGRGRSRQFIGAEFRQTLLRLLLGQPLIEVCLQAADEIVDRLAVGFSVLHAASFCCFFSHVPDRPTGRAN